MSCSFLGTATFSTFQSAWANLVIQFCHLWWWRYWHIRYHAVCTHDGSGWGVHSTVYMCAVGMWIVTVHWSTVHLLGPACVGVFISNKLTMPPVMSPLTGVWTTLTPLRGPGRVMQSLCHLCVCVCVLDSNFRTIIFLESVHPAH